ncbi:unnamed protein product, partial [Mesorhabditis spiculigera]
MGGRPCYRTQLLIYLFLVLIILHLYLRQDTCENQLQRSFLSLPVFETTSEDFSVPSTSVKTIEETPFSIKFKNANFKSTYRILPEATNCSSALLLAVVLSQAKHFKIRETIRETWGRVETKMEPNLKVLFIIGRGRPEENMLIYEEAEEYGDILVISSPDTYRNLVHKSLALFYYHQTYCPTRYLLKIDDDVLFDFSRFFHFQAKGKIPENPPAIFGKLWRRSKPFRNPKHRWYISPRHFDHKFLPSFCGGPSYILTRGAVAQLLNSTRNVPFIYNVEDVLLTGILAEAAGVKRIDMPRSVHPNDRLLKPNPYGIKCDMDGVPYLFAVHGRKTPATIRSGWEKLSSLNCTYKYP